ncbi:MAG: hypothetical protein RLZZ383_2824 [Pseudomonadota bacterium]
MQVMQTTVRSIHMLPQAVEPLARITPDLWLVFASTTLISSDTLSNMLRDAAPGAAIVGCSTAGEIDADGVDDASCVVTALRFERSRLQVVSAPLSSMAASRETGAGLGRALAGPELRAVLVLAPGLAINGSALVQGIVDAVGTDVPVVGGLAGDDGAFERTFTLGPAGATDHAVIAIGLYGDAIRFGYGSYGGWLPFGPARKVTRADNNILYELDGEPALEVYKRYLGDYAAQLPSSGLLFPFAMLDRDEDESGLIRTILGVDEATGSLTLAGEIVEDGYLKLMHASTDRLVSGAESAASAVEGLTDVRGGRFALLVSCVGRKLIMGSRTEEEVEAVRDVLGPETVIAGFYSNGEISPFKPHGVCRLHNQTMTVAAFGEA